MNLGEIKLESLRLMNANDGRLTIEHLEDYMVDEQYKDYLDRMDGAINRAVSRMTMFNAIPSISVEIKPSQAKVFKQYLKLNLKEIIPNYEKLVKVIYIYERVVPNIPYESLVEGEILIPYSSSYNLKGMVKELPQKAMVGDAYHIDGSCMAWNGRKWEEITEEESFVIEYIPKIETIKETTDNLMELPMPDTLARIIPYFVKAELYEIEEPNASAMARNIFENALQEYLVSMPRKNNQRYVSNEMW